MKKVGILIAVEIEAILNSDYELEEEINIGKFKVYRYHRDSLEIIAIHSGIGQTQAAAATEILCSIFNVEAVLNFGVVGALKPELSLEMVVLVDKIVDYQFDTSKIDNVLPAQHENYPSIYIDCNNELLETASALDPEIKKVTCASGNLFVTHKATKRRLANKFKCDIVEMEAASIKLIADMHDVPTLFIKAISDSCTGDAHQYYEVKLKAAKVCFDTLTSLINKI